jgi:class 3 adenylate cyclase
MRRASGVVCPACGFENQPSAKFCGGCATRLNAAVAPPAVAASPESYTPKPLAERILRSRGALECERKQVTVLFADIKGSMELIHGGDLEEARRILDPAIAATMNAVHRYEGTVNKVLGDGIMALFGAPIAHEDHAVRACYAALAMQNALRELSERARWKKPASLSRRCAVSLRGSPFCRARTFHWQQWDLRATGSTRHCRRRAKSTKPQCSGASGETSRG